MGIEEQLNKVLEALNNEHPRSEYFSEVKNRIPFEISDKALQLILDKLFLDGYVNKRDVLINKIPNGNFTYNIKADGQLFLLDGGYLEFFIKKRKRNKFEKTSRIWIIINTMATLLITAYGVWINYESNKNDNRVNRLELRIEKQSETIKSLNQIILLRGHTTKQ